MNLVKIILEGAIDTILIDSSYSEQFGVGKGLRQGNYHLMNPS